jgi:alcohol dehydrogenase class IV
MIPNVKLDWPSTIEFGAGKISTLVDHLIGKKRVFFLVDPPMREKVEPFIKKVEYNNSEILISTNVVPEPPISALEQLLKPVNDFKPDAIVGIGGGSAIDLAKVVAVLFDGKQKIGDIIGIGNVSHRDVKLISVSTTSGTGSEVTPIAVLTDVKAKLKKGVVSKFLVPDVAIVDPELTITLPPEITAATGMDAMTHCIEAYTNRHAHPIIDNITLEGIRLIAENLEAAVKDGNNVEARSAMALGSLYGGLALGPVNTAAVHALAYPLGGEFKISHGVSNSVLLPFIMNFNMPSCSYKYAKIAEVIGVERQGTEEEMAKQGVLAIRALSERCGIPSSIKTLEIPESAIPSMAEGAMKVTRLLENNPRELKLEDAVKIYENAYNGVVEF